MFDHLFPWNKKWRKLVLDKYRQPRVQSKHVPNDVNKKELP